MTQVIDEETHNEAWLEAAKENYETAMETEDWSTALAVIDDIKDAYGAAAGITLAHDFMRRKTSVSSRKLTPFDVLQAQTKVIEDSFKRNDNQIF